LAAMDAYASVALLLPHASDLLGHGDALRRATSTRADADDPRASRRDLRDALWRDRFHSRSRVAARRRDPHRAERGIASRLSRARDPRSHAQAARARAAASRAARAHPLRAAIDIAHVH